MDTQEHWQDLWRTQNKRKPLQFLTKRLTQQTVVMEKHFVQQITEHQNRVYGYVYSLLGDHARAADVVQETNLVLWRKIDEFQEDKPFLPWAFAIARFQVLAHLRDKKRDRLLLDPELAESLCGVVEDQAEQFDDVREALRPCMQTLTAGSADLIQKRYFQ